MVSNNILTCRHQCLHVGLDHESPVPTCSPHVSACSPSTITPSATHVSHTCVRECGCVVYTPIRSVGTRFPRVGCGWDVDHTGIWLSHVRLLS